MTAEMLAQSGVRDPRDLQGFVPNLQFQSGTAATTSIIFLRGVGIACFVESFRGHRDVGEQAASATALPRRRHHRVGK